MRRDERVTVQGPVKKQQPDGMHTRGGGAEANNKVCVPKINLQFWGPLINFFFFSRGKFLWVGGWVRRSRLPSPPPPAQ